MSVAVLVAGCGGGDGASKVLEEAVEKTEAAKTVRMRFEIVARGREALDANGVGVVDFENDRDRLTISVGGQTVGLFTDGAAEYIRLGDSGRYRVRPPSDDAPVANNPADSLRYVASDVVGVESAGGDCYEGELDFDRIRERAEPGRADGFEELDGLRAPVRICLDAAGRIARYEVDVSVGGDTVEVDSSLFDYGEPPPLGPLSDAERPR